MKKAFFTILTAVFTVYSGLCQTKTFTVGEYSFDMIPVEGGTFYMGAQSADPNGINYDPDASEYSGETIVHKVTVSDYSIGKFPVTQGIYYKIVGAEPHSEGESQIWNEGYGYGDNYPAYYLNYDDARMFVILLNIKMEESGQISGTQRFYLPTEAEWEFAARGGNLSKGYKYAGSDNPDEVAWYTTQTNPLTATQIVGQKKPNELGLYDMSGNVSEWCGDYYGTYPEEDQTNPTGPTEPTNSFYYHVLRGGNFASRYSNMIRNTNRSYGPESARNAYNGMRLVLKGTPAEGTDVSAPNENNMFHVELSADNILKIKNVKAGEFACIYTANGQEMYREKTIQEDFEINISDYKSGTYILIIGNYTAKFIKK